jgi:hypothetical protein
MSLRGINDIDRLNWRSVSEALEALRIDTTGPVRDRISDLLARIKDHNDRSQIVGVDAAAG